MNVLRRSRPRLRLSAAALAVALAAIVPAAGAGAQGAAGTVDVRRDVQYGTANGKPLLLDAYLPAGLGGAAGTSGGEPRAAVVLIHGGGFRTGDKASFEPEARKLAALGWVAFSVNYRLDEPSPFPAAVDDVQAAVRWVRANAAEYNVDPARIGALGESAGGHLAGMLATLGEGSRERDARVRMAVSWSGPMDIAALARERGDGWAGQLMGCAVDACPDRYAAASPVTHVDETDAPMFLVNSHDELIPYTQAEAMTQALEDAQVPVQVRLLPGTRHALDYREEIWPATTRFLHKYLDPPGQLSVGTIVFAVTVVVVVAIAAALVLLRRGRRMNESGEEALNEERAGRTLVR